MKLASRDVERTLAKPPADLRAALFFGPDAGLVRERAKALARTVAPDLSDAFRVAELSAAQLAEDPARLADEAASLSLMGGRRVVMVSNAGDKLAKLFQGFLGDPPGDALVVVEAGELAGRSSLRAAFEAAPAAIAVPCYADDARSLRGVIEGMLREAGRKADADAIDYLAANLGGDRLVTRSEMAKLLLYMGEQPGPVTLEDCEAVVGDNAGLGLDDAAYAAFGGDFTGLVEALGRCETAGESAVAVIRVAQKHAQRLHAAAAQSGSGRDPKLLAKSLGVFWKREDAFAAQARRWSPDRLLKALDILTEAELQAKTTGFPAEAACGDALLRIARAAQARR